MSAWIKILSFLAEIVSGFSEWWKKRKRLNEVNANSKAVDSGDDKRLADELRQIADKVDKRNKTN